MMRFEALYYADRLKLINPSGDVGIVTLWSLVDVVSGVLGEAGIDFSAESSRVAVIAHLYGNGLPQMLRNLLWNPQLQHIIILGKNLSGSKEWLLGFFEQGLEAVDFLGTPAYRIKGTSFILDGKVVPEHFAQKLHFAVFGDVCDPVTSEGIRSFLGSLPPLDDCPPERVSPPPFEEIPVTRFPSEPRSHTIVRSTPLDAWRELIFRLFRFGHRNKVAKHGADGQPTQSERIELQNVKVVVEDPRAETDDALAQYGFEGSRFREYQESILN